MNDCCVREKTIRERIVDLARTELCHDYEAEVKQIIALLDEQEKKRDESPSLRVRELERQLEMQNIITNVLALHIGMRGI